ncbi:MAG: DUF6378 domain-containing protein [Gemmatimonadaceae bacterium]|nr:DUF6378 domain-containing protein [Gemmatimonadaceae bacterium]
MATPLLDPDECQRALDLHTANGRRHEKTAQELGIGSAALTHPLTPLDVANMMEAMKIARRKSGSHNIDDYIDGAGYAACAGEIAERAQATPHSLAGDTIEMQTTGPLK